jgi:hypothetical protein
VLINDGDWTSYDVSPDANITDSLIIVDVL